jgi:hypothetical protein
MSKFFISYSHHDAVFARNLHGLLDASGTRAFLAESSIRPGQSWSTEIKTALREATVIIFVASRESCRSTFVQQEIGAAVIGEKQMLPVVLNVPSSELPGWASELQALDLAQLAPGDAVKLVHKFLEAIRGSEQDPWAVATGAAVLAHALLPRTVHSTRRQWPSGGLTCPNCATNSGAVFMSSIPKDFVLLEGGTHECTKCGYKCNDDVM